MLYLKNKGIGSQLHFIPLYHHAFFNKDKERLKQLLPSAEIYYQEALSLPLYTDLEENDVAWVTTELKQGLREAYKI